MAARSEQRLKREVNLICPVLSELVGSPRFVSAPASCDEFGFKAVISERSGQFVQVAEHSVCDRMVSRSYFAPLSLPPVTEELRIWFAKIKKPSGVIEGCVSRESGESLTSQIETSGPQ